ncbi:hypothetical protein N7475_006444 [Penicillium sp. IBT 31633x]|nr:hypothetical protein N7475_006444 [Penicillium sp. IBT 31633x]
MRSSLLRPLSWLRRSWQPLVFSNLNFARINASQRIEKETIPRYITSWYSPIGDLELARLLGLRGTSSENSPSASIQADQDELKIYQRIERASKLHLGRDAIRSLDD